jgi:CspA family cold shock protein
MNCYFKSGPLPKERGEVKWFSERKRYGFLVGERGQEVFFHRDQLLSTNGHGPLQGQEARFHVRYSGKGPEALNVELVENRQ